MGVAARGSEGETAVAEGLEACGGSTGRDRAQHPAPAKGQPAIPVQPSQMVSPRRRGRRRGWARRRARGWRPAGGVDEALSAGQRHELCNQQLC